MSAVRGNNAASNNLQSPDSIKKKVHFEQNDADDFNDSGEIKFVPSSGDVSQLRLRHVRDTKRNIYNNEVFVGKFFTVSPAHTLMFPNGQDKDGNTTLTLTNNNTNIVAYKVKTTAPSKYRVRPGNGILAPGAKAEVVITLIAGHTVNDQSQDKFLVMGMEIKDESIDPLDLSELWRNCSKDKLMEHKLYCDEIIPVVSETEVSHHAPTDHSALDSLRSQNAQLVHEVSSLKTTLHLMLALQLITVIIVIFIHCQAQWSPTLHPDDNSHQHSK